MHHWNTPLYYGQKVKKKQNQTKENPSKPTNKPTKQTNKTKPPLPNKKSQNKQANKTQTLYLYYFMSVEVVWLPVSPMAIILVLLEGNWSPLPAKITTVMEAAKCCFLTRESICRTTSFVCLFASVCVCFLYFWNILESILLSLFLLNSLFSVESNIHMVNSYSSKLCQICAILKLNICYFILL